MLVMIFSVLGKSGVCALLKKWSVCITRLLARTVVSDRVSSSTQPVLDVLQARANVKNNKYKDVYGVVHKSFAPAIVGMSGQIHDDFLRLLWVFADKQMRSYYESMGKEDKIRTEAFR